MALIASDIIDAAKQQSFTRMAPDANLADTLLLSRLSVLDQEITQIATQISPSLVSREAPRITVTKSGNRTGYPLKNAESYERFWWINKDSDKVIPIKIVPELRLASAEERPSAVIINDPNVPRSRLFPIDPRDKLWDDDTTDRIFFKADGDTILYRYVPSHCKLNTLSDELSSPELARSFLVSSMASFITLTYGDLDSERLLERQTLSEQTLRQNLLIQMYKSSNIESNIQGGGRISG